MEGSESGPDGSGRDVVHGRGKRMSGSRNSRFAKASNFPQILPEESCLPPVIVFKEDEMDGSGDVSERGGDAHETNEVGGAKWQKSRISRASGSTAKSIPEGRVLSPGRDSEVVDEESRIGTKGAGNGVVSEVQDHGGRSTRLRRPPRSAKVKVDLSNRWLRGTPAVTQRIERIEPAAFAELSGSQSRGAEASGSGSRDFLSSSSVLGVSSGEKTAIVLGKEPSQEIIDLVSDSPPYGSARTEGMSLFNREGPSGGRGEAGPSQHSVVSPLRRPLQRSTAQRAKRPRELWDMSGRGSSQRPIDLGGDLLIPSGNDQGSILESVDPRNTVLPLLERYNLRRSGSNMALPSNSSGLDADLYSNMTGQGVGRRSGSHRFEQTGSGPGAGFSEFGNDLRRPTVTTDGGYESGGLDLNRPMELENMESPRASSHIPRIDLDDDADTDRVQQVAEDERLARELQDCYASQEIQGEQAPSDEMLARMLQDEENAQSRGLPLGPRSMFLGSMEMQAFLGEMENRRQARRPFRYGLPQNQADQSDNPGSSSRGVRRPRSSALTRMLNPQSAANMDERRVQFPAAMALESLLAGETPDAEATREMVSRLEFLAALEMAFQERLPVGLQLAHVDRDFNENDYEMLLALDTDNDRHRGASRESISQLPLTTVAPTDVCEEDCSICLEVPVAGDVVRRLPCMHVFHQQCIDKWLQCQAVCPVCKAHI